MSTSTIGLFLRHLALSEEVGRLATASDHDLLAAYEAERGQAAFTELMRRHGPMVLRTCRRVLGGGPDAEDAFQATFVLLARQAVQLRRAAAERRSLGGWLHRVAYRTAANVLTETTRRRLRERRRARLMNYADADPVAEATWNEVRPILDAELDALPEQARRLLIACYLQEKTHAEAAVELGLPLGSLAWHLEKARALLAARLARRGITVSVPLLAILLGETARGTGVPAVLLVHTVEAVRTFSEQANGVVSDHVARLVKGGMARIARGSTQLNVTLTGLIGLLGAGLLTCQTLKAWPDNTPPNKPAAAATERTEQEGPQSTRVDRYGDLLPPGALARLGTMRLRHNTWVQSLVYTSDGKGLLTGGGDNLPRLWDAATSKLIREFNNIPKPQLFNNTHYEVFGATLSPNGRILAARSGRMGNLYLLETATGKLLYEFKCAKGYQGNRPSLNFAFSPDGKKIAAQLDGSLEMREVPAGRPIWQKKGQDIVSLAFSPDGKILASGALDEGVRLWDARTGVLWRELGPKEPTNRIAFSPDGRTLAVGYEPSKESNHWRVQLWNVDTGKKVRQLGEPGKSLSFPIFSPDGKILASCSDGEICLWETATGKKLHAFPRVDGGPIAFSPDGKVLAALDDPLVRFWDVASGKELPSRLPTGHESRVNSVAFTPDGQTLISAGADHTVRWWNTRSGQQRLSLQGPTNLHPRQGWFLKAALSSDGTILAGAYTMDFPFGKEGCVSIRLWDATTGKEFRRLEGGNGWAGESTFSPDGKMLAQVSFRLGADSGMVCLWDVASGRRCEHELAGTCPVFALDGSIIATLEGNTLNFWEAATGKKVRSLISANENLRCLAISPDGKILATGSDDKIALYPLSRSEHSGVSVGVSRLIATSHGAGALAFSPDGRMLASGGRDQTAHLWETISGKERAHFPGHSRVATPMSVGITALSFTADGRRLASGSADSTILIWDVMGWLRGREGRIAKSTDKELESLWTDLAGANVARAGQAVWSLVAAGQPTVSFLKDRLRPVATLASSEIVAQLIADLDADSFPVRDRARRKLETMGEECEPALRQVLAKRPSIEMRRSLQELLSKLEESQKNPSGEMLRVVRAVEVLEHIGTPEARQLVDALARGATGARLTEEAGAVLRRLDQRRVR